MKRLFWLSLFALLLANPAAAEDVDLLPLLNLSEDVVNGNWQLVNDELIMEGGAVASRLSFPYYPPPEYDYVVVFTITSGADPWDNIAQLVSHEGVPFAWSTNAGTGHYCRLEDINGHSVIGNPTLTYYPFVDGETYTSIVRVRNDRVICEMNGEVLVEYETDYSDLSRNPKWEMPDQLKIGLGGYGGPITFHSVTVTPIGQFEIVSPENGAEFSWPATLEWSPGEYDYFRLYCVFPYVGVGYYPVVLGWFPITSINMTQPWWAAVGEDLPCYWGVVGYDASSGDVTGLAPRVFTKKPPTPGMVPIPPGCFDMGDAFSEGELAELPVHNVCISGFEMDVHEVTNSEYAECVSEGACTAPIQSYSYTRSSYYGNPAYDDYPVLYVHWQQATEYCTWERKRLPTEAEWEYAARGGLAGKRYPWGDTIDCDDACYGRGAASLYCWDHCHNGVCDNDTHPVGIYAPNGYGLYDMAGNVWEFVNDWWNPDYYQYCVDNGIVNDPPGLSSGSTYHVLRGDSWWYSALYLRVARRGGPYPDENYYEVGFRCARGGAYGP